MAEYPTNPFQNPSRLCPDHDAVEKVFGRDPTALRRLKGFDDKSKEFGDPIEASFGTTQIRPVELRGFGPDHQQSIHLQVNRALHGVLVSAFDEIAASGLSYHLRRNDAGAYLFRYTKNDEVIATIPRRPEYGLYDGKTPPEQWHPPANWADTCAEHDRRNNSFDMEIPVYRQRSKKTVMTKKKDLLSNHSWGTAIDLNYSSNGFSPAKRFDLPPEIVAILVKHGFYWGGYYHDYMHFEFLQPPPQGQLVLQTTASQVVFPFGEPGKHESPVKYFFLNEHHGRGGYFPLGLYQNLHGGIHLNPSLTAESGAVEDSDLPESAGGESESARTSGTTADAPTEKKSPLLAVRAGLPGYIVAARLVDPVLYKDNNRLRQNLEDQPLGFVLIRHELKAAKPTQKSDNPSGTDGKDGGTGKDAPAEAAPAAPFYSLCMHLGAPKWDAAGEDERKSDKQFEAAPWLEKFLRMEYGGVVALDPEKEEDFGKTFWASQKFDEKDVAPVSVRGREAPIPRRDSETTERVVGYGKPSPSAIQQAIERFKKGAVVTFDRPVLPVAKGEVIGFLSNDVGLSRRYLHWEIFAQPGQGLAKLRELAGKLGIQFAEPLKELREDNFLEMPSLQNPGAPDEIGECFKKKDPVLNPVITRAPYAKKLVEAFQKGEEFAEGGKAPFRYPTTLKFANPYHFRPEKDEEGKVTVTYLANGKAVERASEVALEFGEHITLALDVPAAADMLRLQSPRFRLELSPPPGAPEQAKPDKRRERAREARRALWKAVTGRRWRDLVLEHVNEWTADNLAKYIRTKVKAAYFESTEDKDREKLCKDLERDLGPLAWYAGAKATDASHGEQPALGEGSRTESLFGADGAFLPKDGHIESMHPATTLWLMDLLLDEGTITIRDKWEPDSLIAETPSDEPLFFTVIEPRGGAALGAYVGLALIQQGYEFSSACKDSGVIFTAVTEDGTRRILALASYVEGAAVAKTRFPLWGKTEIKVEAQQRETKGGRPLKPRMTGTTALDLPCPVFAGTHFGLTRAAGAKPSDNTWSGTILAKDACPYALEGYLAFTYWKADAGKQPDLTQPGVPGKVLWPVVAERYSPEEHERDGLKFKGEFIVGVAGKKGKTASPRTVRVSADFTLHDFMDKKVAEAAEGEFKVALPLVQRVQALRDACKGKNRGEKTVTLNVSFLEKYGLVLSITSPSIPALIERANTLPASDLFTLEANPDGKSLQLTYSPLPATGTLTFTTDLGPALQALANSASSKTGEQVFARPTFLAPNGGHQVFVHLEAPPHIDQDQVVLATADELRAASAGKPIELETEVVLPPAHAFGFGPLTLTMGRTGLRTSVELLGPAKDWGNAKLRISCKVDEDEISGGVRERDRVSETWYLEKWSFDKKGKPKPPPKHRWQKKLEFKVEATNTKGMAHPPAPISAAFEALPRLLNLDARLVDGKVVLSGSAHAMPTSSDLAIRCQRQTPTGEWKDAAGVMNTLRYRRPSATGPNMWGGPDEDGTFGAETESSAFDISNYRFIWYVAGFSSPESELDDKLVLKTPYGFNIDPLVSRIYSGPELGGAARPEGGGVLPGADNPREVIDGGR